MPSGDPAQAQRLFKAGMEHYSKGQYQEALSTFDRAISLGDKGWKVMDAKAAAMNKMGGAWRTSAFEIASALCKKYGDKSHRPWYRVASILISLGMVDAAERSITKGLSLAKDDGSRNILNDLRVQGQRVRERLADERASNAEAAKAERIAAKKASMCYAHLLSADILLQVADAGLATDPDFAIRMAGVCRDWRATVLSQSALWSTLRLGHRRPVAKATLWAERSRGRLRQVTITDRVSSDRARDLAAVLKPHVSSVERLTVHGRLLEYLEQWRERFCSLQEIVLRGENNDGARAMELLHPHCTSLRVFDVDRATFLNYHIPQGITPYQWAPGAEHLRTLRRFRIGTGQICEPSMGLPTLLQRAPQMRELELGCIWEIGRTQNDEETIVLDNLERLELRDPGGLVLPSQTLVTPALKHYSCYHWRPASGTDTLANLRAPGLVTALPNLVSLDIGRCGMLQHALLALLPDLKSLRFLNLSFNGIDNDFLEALVVEVDKEPLLPSLTALSVAGHDTISAGPLRRIVLSRSGEADAIRKIAPVPAKRSAFAPARSMFAPARPAPKALPEPSPPSAGALAAARVQTAPMTWICVDHCNNAGMDVGVLASLRKRLRFLSNFNGNVVEDRIRGRGAYAWDGALNGSDGLDRNCGAGTGGCHLRKRRADDDGWYVHHTCKRAKEEEKGGVKERGWRVA